MLETDPRIADALDRLVPAYDDERGDWGSVAAAGARRRRLPRLALALAPAVAAAAALALAWPFGGGDGRVLERALAAVRGGPVLHVVFREEWGGTLVDLETGERRRVRGEREVWYDARRGVHEIARLGGDVLYDALSPAGRPPRHVGTTSFRLLAEYPRALERGEARVLGRGVVDGIDVHWVLVSEEAHENTRARFEVAVSRETYEPVATRVTVDGHRLAGSGSRILEFETLAASEGNFEPAPPNPPAAGELRMRPVRELTLREARQTGSAVWAGHRVDGLPLVGLREVAWSFRRQRPGSAWRRVVTATQVTYGSGRDVDASDALSRPHRDFRAPLAQISAFASVRCAFVFDLPCGYVPPPGTVFLVPRERSVAARAGLLRHGGLFITIHASSDDLLLAAARALRPLG
ncbi:MAG: hypothetical protein ICV64_07690 [Thermoleophilia bacterium]|nr:hypothetical protein [Thermoleophilia bacterium]